MRVIISPAKRMRVDTDALIGNGLPALLPRAEVLMDYIRGLSYAEQKALWACSDKIARGDMVRYMAEIQAEAPEQIKSFDQSGYRFDEARSSGTEYVFTREAVPGRRGHARPWGGG